MTIGPTAGGTLPPPSTQRAWGARVFRRTTGLLFVLLAVLIGLAFGIRAVWPAASSTQLVKETNDNGYFVVIDQAGGEVASGSATQQLEGGDDVRVEAWGSLVPGGALRVDATVANASQSVLEFHGGLRIEVTVTREGTPWRTAEIAAPGVTELAPGGTFAGHATVSGLQGPAQFVLSATMDTWRR
jgi:hypothetical protein